MKLTKLLKLAIPMATVAMALPASAAYLSGSIGFSGATNTLPNPDDIPNATGVSFSGAKVEDRSGDYASVPLDTPVTFSNYSFNPFAASLLWTFTLPNNVTYSFTTSSLLDTGGIPGVSRTFYGAGTATITGFDPTPGFYQISVGQLGSALTFQSTAFVPPPRVPDGGATAALLGLSLLGLSGVRRFIK